MALADLRRSAATRFLWWLRRLRGTPDALGRGFAVGTFVAFTPTVGIQMIVAALLATAVKGSRPAAILPVWISNPVTFPFVYGMTYRIGRTMWPGRSDEGLATALTSFLAPLQITDPWEVGGRIGVLLALGRDVAIPLWIGGVLVGLVAALLAYYVTISTVATARATLRKRQRRRPNYSPSRRSLVKEGRQCIDGLQARKPRGNERVARHG